MPQLNPDRRLRTPILRRRTLLSRRFGEHGVVSSGDWYRSRVWDDAARAEFERRLARHRGLSAAQYLRIQGLILLESPEPAARVAGKALLGRVIAELPDAHAEVAGAHVHLASELKDRGELKGAVGHLRAAVVAERMEVSGQWGADLDLASLLAADPEGRDDLEARTLLDASASRGVSPFASLQLRYLLARARVEHRSGRRGLAAAYALGVLELLAGAPPEPDLNVLGQELDVFVGGGDPEAVSALVDEFRGADGNVRWIWALVSDLHRAPARGEALPDTPQRLIAGCQAELREAGFEVFSLSSWSVKNVAGAREARRAADILVRWFEGYDDHELRAAAAGALGDPRVRAIAAEPLLDAYRDLHSPQLADHASAMTEELGRKRRLKSALGQALAILARDPVFDRVAELVRDPRHGSDRAYLFWAIEHMKDPRAVDLCLELLDDRDQGIPALYALSGLRSRRARPRLLEIAAEPTAPPSRRPIEARPEGRDWTVDPDLHRHRVALAGKAIQKLDRAISSGKAKP